VSATATPQLAHDASAAESTAAWRAWPDARRETVLALVHTILQGAPLASERAVAVAQTVARRADTLAAGPARDLARVFALFGSPLVGLVTVGRPVRFAEASSAERVRWLARWSHSPLPSLRSAFQAVRRLVLGTHYGDATVALALGHAGPLHARTPSLSWEGALPASFGTTDDDGPVAIGDADLRPVLSPVPPPRGVVRGDMGGPDRRRADAVVIGTGAGGAVAAARLAEAGLEVVLLEDGAWHDTSQFTEDEGTLVEHLYADGALRATDDLALQLLQGRSVGGSTTINWMIMLRTPPAVLAEWTRDHGLRGMDDAALAPVFARVEQEVHARRVPDDAHSPNNRLLLDGARALGWRASSAVINARGCVRSGACGIGCRYDAKQAMTQTYIPRALAAGATLHADTRAERIEVRERDGGAGTAPLKRVHATVRDARTGVRRAFVVEAPLVVVAGGAVETPALLQRSVLGNANVGRWLRLHPTTATLAQFPHEIVGSTGIPLSTLCDEHTRWNGSDYGFWLECPPFLPALGSVAVPGFGAAHAALLRDFRRLGSVIALTRDGAERTRSSGAVTARRHGGVSIRYALTAADAQRVRASIGAAARLQLAAGATVVRTLHTTPIEVRREADLDAIARASVAANAVGMFSAHVNGTCRMGGSPATAATDPDGQLYGARGVVVSDGSLLPTAPGVNPQETIMALATVVAERLIQTYGPSTSRTGESA
jgi:choline dehydrogenase-like flavoprotein